MSYVSFFPVCVFLVLVNHTTRLGLYDDIKKKKEQDDCWPGHKAALHSQTPAK